MCGITGHVRPGGQPVQQDEVEAASRILAHRGPDGDGIVNWPGMCFAHRRLSIIDIEHSAQPWISQDKRYALVFNGEIYNYRELRRVLEKEGIRFQSQGDTEVLFHMVIREGSKCLNRLNGMFAFAFWDSERNRLFLARDRLGEKPLYYTKTKDGLAFASEISALHCFRGVASTIDQNAIHDYFAYQYIPGHRSIYSGIHKLPPGHFLEYQDGKTEISRYWSPPHPQNCELTIDEAGEQLRYLMKQAVDLRLRSDVPLGAFLSGGIDSAIIVATMDDLGITAETFTVGFSEESFDESKAAKQTADFLGTHHHQSILHQDISNLPADWLQFFGEPFADHSAIPVWHVCKYAREHVTVALSGDGGDELFAGYRRYRGSQLLKTFDSIPKFAQKAITQIAKKLPDSDHYYATSLPKKLRLFLAMHQRFSETPHDLNPQVFTSSERIQLLGDEPLPSTPRNSVKEFYLEGLDRVSQMQLTDLYNYLPEDILSKVDRMSMAHGLEVRAPMLDYRLVEFICSLPLHYKIHRSNQKYLLKMAFRDRLPPYLMTRKKQGFNLPTSHWLKGPLKSEAEQTILHNIPAFFNKVYLQQLWREHQSGRMDHGAKLWSLFVYGQWHQNVYQSN